MPSAPQAPERSRGSGQPNAPGDRRVRTRTSDSRDDTVMGEGSTLELRSAVHSAAPEADRFAGAACWWLRGGAGGHGARSGRCRRGHAMFRCAGDGRDEAIELGGSRVDGRGDADRVFEWRMTTRLVLHHDPVVLPQVGGEVR